MKDYSHPVGFNASVCDGVPTAIAAPLRVTAFGSETLRIRITIGSLMVAHALSQKTT